jgi:hypothetical protein
MAAAGAVLVTAAGVQGIAQAVSSSRVVTPSATTATAVDAQVAKDLQLTREEERMARDLYSALAAKYDDAVPFSHITHSEQRHFDAVGTLLTRYGVSDPSAGKAAGTYAYPELQKLYDGWLAQGGKSLDAAYDVGIALEKRDIADLKKIAAATKDDSAKTLFTRLGTASEHHLAAYEAAAAGKLPADGSGGGWMGGRQGNGQMGGMMGRGQGSQTGPGAGMGQGGRMGPGAGMGTGDCPMDDDET